MLQRQPRITAAKADDDAQDGIGMIRTKNLIRPASAPNREGLREKGGEGKLAEHLHRGTPTAGQLSFLFLLARKHPSKCFILPSTKIESGEEN
ncbi:hypothetical protein ZHAS_00021349 [Anopheles sinensis]|uniref:Uncharacterized protein n=1 Tax=Anopheles sinensis TaxID=74873 RepID=A0A084WS54_ANOSI|nr:hypothetical protein ZHAS_00021349 [Anopheles sinensis]